MRHLKNFNIFEWDIPGDPTGDSNLMVQNLRIPDTISLQKTNINFNKLKKKKLKIKKKYRQDDIQ